MQNKLKVNNSIKLIVNDINKTDQYNEIIVLIKLNYNKMNTKLIKLTYNKHEYNINKTNTNKLKSTINACNK